MSYNHYPKIEDMVGKVFTKVLETGDELIFENDAEIYTFYHGQDCCESVYIESIVGELSDLIGQPLLRAECVDGETPADFDADRHESYTWTFYKFATIKGYVDVRWFGTSNGYYSEGVSLSYSTKTAK